MAASSYVASAGTSWSKWQMALLVGTPVVIGIGCWYIKYKRNCTKGTECNNAKIESFEDVSQGNRPSSTHLPFVSTQNLSPLEIAMANKDAGNVLFKKHNYQEAIKYYTIAINTCPKENGMELSKFYQNRAAARRHLELYDDAWSDCSRAIELNPKYVKAFHQRAKVSDRKRNYEQCLEDLTTACVLEGYQNQMTILSTDYFLRKLGMKQAKEFMLTRYPMIPSDDLILSYFSAFTEDPVLTTEISEQEKEGGFSRAKAAFLSHNFSCVIDACNDEINATHSSYKMEAHVLKASFEFLSGEYSSALHGLTVVVENNQAPAKLQVNALIKRAFVYLQLEQEEKGFKDYDAAINIAPDTADIYYHRGQVFLLMNNVTQALVNFNQVLTLTPDFPLGCVQKGYADYRHAVLTQNTNKMEDAVTALQKVVDRFPNYWKGYAMYAEVLLDQLRYEEADLNLLRALELDPGNASLYVHRGTLRLQWTGDFEAARSLFKRAIKLDPSCLNAYETLGTIEVQQGNLPAAIEWFDKAIPLARSEPESFQLFTMRDAAAAQLKAAPKIDL